MCTQVKKTVDKDSRQIRSSAFDISQVCDDKGECDLN